MDNPATNDFPIHELLQRRWSPRAFSEKQVPPEVLRSLFEAARWAASCFNDQPWAYLVAPKENPEEFARLASVLMEGNAVWASRAPVLALSLARTSFQQNNQPNRHAMHDLGAASASLTLEATARGLAVHQMAGFFADKARDLFRIPDGWEPMAAIAIGYPGDPDSPRRNSASVSAPRAVAKRYLKWSCPERGGTSPRSSRAERKGNHGPCTARSNSC